VSKEVVPRWEWRTFGHDLGDAQRWFAAREAESAQESDETYVLSRESDASVKIRGGQLDVKRCEQVDDAGLEQWRPVLKASFPLSAADVGTALEALGVDAPLPEGEYPQERLMGEVVARSPDLLALDVHKRREHYTVGGAMAELSEVRTEDGSRRTIAVESEDPAKVVAAVRELGLSSRRNVNMARGLKALAGFGGRRFAVIDVGTNSVKLFVAERAADGEWTTVVDRSEITRLGEGLAETGRLNDEAAARTLKVITAMADEARRLGAESIAAVGTAGLRIAADSAQFAAAVREHAGVEPEVLSGEEESRLAYLAAEASVGVGEESIVVFDTGGGSSQFTFGHGDQVEERFSVEVGAVRYTERFGLDGEVDAETLTAAREAIAGDLARLDGRPTPDRLIGIGGAVTNLTAVKLELADYDPDAVRGSTLEAAEVERQIELYRTRSADERREIVGLQPKRAEVILAGACIVRTVLDKLGRDSLTVSDRGLRHGLMLERFGYEGLAE
jgi:exopolyphosphatase / guanosine-5'-triphosphate,3'-diphosphate pyrophosphatase